MDETVVVAGAGLAGLVAARHLAEEGADVIVYERRHEVGGRVRTQKRDGFTFDRGFQVLFTGYPAVRRELDVDELDLRQFDPGAVIARRGERSTLSDPIRDPKSLLATLRNDEVTLTDKVRTLALRQHVGDIAEETSAGRRTRSGDASERRLFEGPDTSIREYLREWGFSEDYIENFVAPFYGGITLDRSLSTSKRVFEATFKALSNGRIGVPAEGMQAIPEQLAEKARRAGAEIRLETGVESVENHEGGVTVRTTAETVEADAAVVAADPKESLRLSGVDEIPTTARTSTTQYYRVPAGTDLDTGRKLLVNAENDAPNTVAPMSKIAPEYAPDDYELLSATFLGAAAADKSAMELAADTRRTLKSWYPDRSFGPVESVQTDRIRFAQFDQPPGVHDRLPDARAPGGWTYLAGDYTTWSSIQGAMRSGREAADAVAYDLRL
ncbi:UDP-galactopyranose mutase [Halopelagius inordinatus]|uniref:UDP-galactopyranose mutase n=1 Tax=Halopelagius inordinatus TaxID=553467 RepID=A0A1I2MU01_9EURY|nr:NAD(P)/FAD-dependent oxidoreductase [Halopelagius inordinatus]SFF94608.1 UDP-galactopyranose mutase [Halopelagius inordinatus]